MCAVEEPATHYRSRCCRCIREVYSRPRVQCPSSGQESQRPIFPIGRSSNSAMEQNLANVHKFRVVN